MAAKAPLSPLKNFSKKLSFGKGIINKFFVNFQLDFFNMDWVVIGILVSVLLFLKYNCFPNPAYNFRFVCLAIITAGYYLDFISAIFSMISEGCISASHDLQFGANGNVKGSYQGGFINFHQMTILSKLAL